ncbi:MAG: hypothetical protein ACOCQX_03870 [Candidatus Nanoarchaeia archaeon]
MDETEYLTPSAIVDRLGLLRMSSQEMEAFCSKKFKQEDGLYPVDNVVDALVKEADKLCNKGVEFKWEDIKRKATFYKSASMSASEPVYLPNFWRSNVEKLIQKYGPNPFTKNAQAVLNTIDGKQFGDVSDYVQDVAHAITNGSRIDDGLSKQYLLKPFNLEARTGQRMYEHIKNIPACQRVFTEEGIVPEGVVSVTVQPWYVNTIERKTGKHLESELSGPNNIYNTLKLRSATAKAVVQSVAKY